MRRQFVLDDPVIALKRMFGGINYWLQPIGFGLFIVPYIWFLLTQLFRSEYYSYLANASDQNSPIAINLIRYIWSGGTDWREWIFCPTSLIAAVYAFCQIVRSFYWLKHLGHEHHRSIFGIYPNDDVVTQKTVCCLYILLYVSWGLAAFNILIFLCRSVPL